MTKVMVFIDGTWLYSSTSLLSEAYGESDYHLDFGQLPVVLADIISKDAGLPFVDLVSTHLFGSYAVNCDPQDEYLATRRREFFTMLREKYHYEIETYPINFLGRRLRRADRDVEDSFEPKERCLDIGMATSMLYYAALHAYDIAIGVLGDRDFIPGLQKTRRLGKRLAIASIRRSCAPEYSDPADETRVKDFDIIWLDDLLSRLELRYERHQLRCESPHHVGDRMVWTTFHPRRGQKFYCDTCRDSYRGQKVEPAYEYTPTHLSVSGNQGFSSGSQTAPGVPDKVFTGIVKKKVSDRGFGFIGAEDGRDYFFHFTDLIDGLEFDMICEGLEVEFQVRKLPLTDKAGAAKNVRLAATEDDEELVLSDTDTVEETEETVGEELEEMEPAITEEETEDAVPDADSNGGFIPKPGEDF